ncbi:MAG: LytTR family DNA-binding domain-containing protein [Clostridiaceae bacterium]|nr:LytTR family DNA-binding domain-containing protein [Clostridiaceae bacterium]
MPDLRVILAEDDPGMRLVLRRLIEKEDGFTLVGEAENGLDAVNLARELAPDVAFLDIEMPGADGLATARTLCAENDRLAIIFATGHDEFMSDAFELYAFDYLLKPFDLARVHKTLTRLRDTFAERRTETPVRPTHVRHDRLTLRSRDGITFVDPATILFIERIDRESILTTTEGELATSEGLNDLYERLDPGIFLRTHRSYIVNVRKIVRAVPYGRWTYTLYLKGTDKTALVTSDKLTEIS